MTEWVEECANGHYYKAAHIHVTCPICGGTVIQSREIIDRTQGDPDE
jgi:hypothetical protein